MPKRCQFCDGDTEKNPSGGITSFGGGHVCCGALFKESYQREALESAANMLERQASAAMRGETWQRDPALAMQVLNNAAAMVKGHDPSAKPKPRVSRKVVEAAVLRAWSDPCSHIYRDFIRELEGVLELTDD